jgi:hypothetical protein
MASSAPQHITFPFESTAQLLSLPVDTAIAVLMPETF